MSSSRKVFELFEAVPLTPPTPPTPPLPPPTPKPSFIISLIAALCSILKLLTRWSRRIRLTVSLLASPQPPAALIQWEEVKKLESPQFAHLTCVLIPAYHLISNFNGLFVIISTKRSLQDRGLVFNWRHSMIHWSRDPELLICTGDVASSCSAPRVSAKALAVDRPSASLPDSPTLLFFFSSSSTAQNQLLLPVHIFHRGNTKPWQTILKKREEEDWTPEIVPLRKVKGHIGKACFFFVFFCCFFRRIADYKKKNQDSASNNRDLKIEK